MPQDPESLLEHAAALAQRGRGDVEPNPRVGALALQEGRVTGEGWHEFYGGPHAEERALDAARAAGAAPDTVAVTLEPCSSDGASKKRPPCMRLLVEAGIRRVVVGCVDPDPRHAGAGLDALRAAGIEVVGPVASAACDELLATFRRGLALRRPWVLAKWAMTLDGKTATRTGSARWISDDAGLDWAHELRSRCDAVVVGIGTAVHDDPELTVRRIAGTTPLRVVVDPDGELRPDSRLLATAASGPVLVVVAGGAGGARIAALKATAAEVVVLPEVEGGGGRWQVAAPALMELLAERGARRVLVEGGGGLVAQLLEAGCVDQVSALIAPKLCGGRDAFTPVRGDGIALMDEAVPLEDCYDRRIGSCWLVGGFVRRDRS